MTPNLIAIAVPVFFLLILAEAVASQRREDRVYRFSDAITDLSCGISSRMFHLFDLAVILAVYTWVYTEFAVFQPSNNTWWLWLGAFVGLDLLYYVWHRASHEVNALWAVHGVHHQSEDYNLAVALRQALFSSLTSLPFYLPLAILGVPPVVFAACSALNTLYQFWIHTELVRKTPRAIEAVFNMPSHHRVHHGINPQYLDKNHAGVFIVWDRLFGTFEPEGELVVYGLVSPLRSFNPLWANFAHFRDMAALMATTSSWADKIRILFKGPAWRPGGVEKVAPVVVRGRFVKYDPQPSRALIAYISVWFVVVAAATVWLMVVSPELQLAQRVTGAVWVVWTLVTWGGLMESRPWAVGLEWARLAVTVVLPVLFLTGTSAAVAVGIAAVAAVGSAWWVPRLTSTVPSPPCPDLASPA